MMSTSVQEHNRAVRVDGRARSSWVEIDHSAFVHNLAAIRNRIGSQVSIMAVLKANAYGHGSRALAQTLIEQDVHHFGVACLQEALELREVNSQCSITVLGAVGPDFWSLAAQHNIILTLHSLPAVEALPSFPETQRPRFQLKIDSGMHRLGLGLDQLHAAAKILSALNNFQLTGVFSHLANSDDEQDSFADQQRHDFTEALNTLPVSVSEQATRHLANSAGIFRDSRYHFDMVRPGIALYGYCPLTSAGELLPVMRLVSHVVQLRWVDEGDSVGYDRFFRASERRRIAVIPCGYADGYSRAYQGADFLVRGQRCPSVGRICMDMCFVDVTTLTEVELGDEVVLLGKQQEECISAYELAKRAGTTHYEVLTSIGARLHRVQP